MIKKVLAALAVLFLFAHTAGPAIAASPTPSIRVMAAANLDGPAGRSVALNLVSAAAGVRGTLVYTDRASRLRLQAEHIDSLTIADGTATLIGAGRATGAPGYRFRLVLREPRGKSPAHLTVDLSGPAFPAYRADADLSRATVRLIGGVSQPTATPTPQKKPVVAEVPAPAAEAAPASDAVEKPYQPSSRLQLASPEGSVVLDVPDGAAPEPALFEQVRVETPATTGGAVRSG